MKDIFIQFLKETTKENYLAAQQAVFEAEQFNPYSDDLEKLQKLLNKDQYQEVTDYHSVNLLLSPRAHLYKRYAYQKLGDEQGARSEEMIAVKLLEGIGLTGNGSQESPYRVTTVSDERDFLQYIDEQFASQRLLTIDGRHYDQLTTASGRHFFFDITTAYSSLQSLMNKGIIQTPGFEENDDEQEEIPVKEKKWWQFWR